MVKEFTPMLVRIDFDIVKDPFDPDREYSAKRRFEKVDKRLDQTIQSRFPNQPSFPDKHKLLSTYFIVETAIKGDLMLSQMNRLENEYFDMIRDQSLAYDIARRIEKRKEFIRTGYEIYWKSEKIKTDEKYKYLFELRADNNFKTREKFRIANTKAWLDRQPIMRLRNERREDERVYNHDKYEEAVLKGLEEVPREMVVTGSSLQQVLNEISNSEGGAVLGAYKRIQENVLQMYADQINDHVKSHVPNSVMYAASVEISSSQNLASTNTQAILSGLREGLASSVHGVLSAVEDNLDRAHADQINDHMPPSLSGPIQKYAGAGDYRIEAKKDRELAYDVFRDDERDFLRAKIEKDQRKNLKINNQLIDRAFMNHKQYWISFDKNHEKIVKTIPSSGTNTSEVYGDIPSMGSQTINHLVQRVKKNIETRQANNIAAGASDSVPNSVLYHMSYVEPEFPTVSSIQILKLDKARSLESFAAEDHQNDEFSNDITMQVRMKSRTREEKVDHVLDEAKGFKEQWFHMKDLKSIVAHEFYWDQYDKIHQYTPRSLSTSATNNNSLLRELPFQSPSKIHFSLATSNKDLVVPTDAQARELYAQIDKSTKMNEFVRQEVKSDDRPKVPIIDSIKDEILVDRKDRERSVYDDNVTSRQNENAYRTNSFDHQKILKIRVNIDKADTEADAMAANSPQVESEKSKT